MTKTVDTDLCVIGAGSGGLSVAAGAVQMGARVVLIEGGEMGGDCLNTGCVPSKALLAAGKHAQAFRHPEPFGIAAADPGIDFARANAHVHEVIAGIAPHDSVERFEGLGVTVIRDWARFDGPRRVVAGETTVTAKWFVVATGSRAAIPPVPGLAEATPLTNETIFTLTACPEHLVIIGGGPIGVEMAQAHRRLGAQVTILERATLLPRDDADHVAVVRQHLSDEGITIREGVELTGVERASADGPVTVRLKGTDGAEETVTGSHLLVAAGRKTNVDGLDLDKAGVKYTPAGITTDARLRSSNTRVFAVGDVAGGPQFTHLAGYHASIVIQNILFRVPSKARLDALPRVTYTDPELASVGLSLAEARKAYGASVRELAWPFKENDRARAERRTEGHLKAVVAKNGKVLGASIVGASAGEMIQVWGLAISAGLKVKALASMIAAYPTLSEVSKRAAGSFYTPVLFSDRTRSIVRFLMRFA